MHKQTTFRRIPRHVGVIPDGNRRWALQNNLEKQDGYAHGVDPGVGLYDLMVEHGVEEATFYGFTKDNTARPAAQTAAYVKACIQAVEALAKREASILVVGKVTPVFPKELVEFTQRRVTFGKGLLKANFLINYDWDWDLSHAMTHPQGERGIAAAIASREISRMDLIIRWGGRTRLSGFLPVQSVYSDFYVVDSYWPDYQNQQFLDALAWYQDCDITLGG